MKPEEQVRANFEAHIKQEWGYIPETELMNDGSEQYVGSDQECYEGYRAAYAQARREALERDAAILALSHRIDDEAQGITEGQVYELATQLRILLGLDGKESASQAIAPLLQDLGAHEASNRIKTENLETLREQNAKLREALRWMAAVLQCLVNDSLSDSSTFTVNGEKRSLGDVLDLADAALGESNDACPVAAI